MSIKKHHISNKQTIIKNTIYTNKFFFFKYIFQTVIFLSILKQYNFIESFLYPKAFTLKNGNIFLIHNKAIDIYYSSFTKKNKTIIYFMHDNNNITNDYNIYKRNIISSYNENNIELLTSIINDKIYIFNEDGEKLYNSDKKISIKNVEYYILVPIKKINNNYYYMIGYINKNNNILQVIFFKFENNTQNNILLYNNSIFDLSENDEFTNKLLTCQLMKNNTGYELITCFYCAKNYFEYFFIDTEKYSIIKTKNNRIKFPNDVEVIKEIKSLSYSDKSKLFICFNTNSGNGYCFTYSIIINNFSKYTQYFSNCKLQNNIIEFNYIKETKQYIYSYINKENNLNLIIFNSNFQFLNNYTINNSKFDFGYSIVFSKNREKYIIISDKINEISKSVFNNNFTNIDLASFIKENKLRNLQETNNCGTYEKCLTCNNESISRELCLSCNTEKGYYPIKLNSNLNQLIADIYIDCYNNKTKPKNFFFNEDTNSYEQCYWTCASCNYKGNGNENNCTTCAMDYIKEPAIEGTTNCVVSCKNFYYYTSYGQYKCSSNPQCPEENNLLIRDKKKCVKSCLKEGDLYIYQYNGECLKKCPSDTKEDENFICRIIEKEVCSKSITQFDLYDFLKEGGVEKIAKTYAKEFIYTDKHISLYKNDVYSIMLYKSTSCITELQLSMPEIDFGECYIKVKAKYNITVSLIVGIIDKSSSKKSNPITSYSFYNPITGDKLDTETACKEEVIVVKENLKSLLNDSVSNMDSILFLTEQNIDVFNKSSGFYTDICYHYESPSNKDVALRDRLLIYYPNITLCDNGCDNTGVNLTSMTAICECKFKEMSDEDENDDNSNLYQTAVNEVFNILNQINIAILACYKDLFDYKYFISCTGGLIVLILIFIQIVNCFIYYFLSFFSVKKYMFNMTESYLLYLNRSPFYKPYVNKLNEEEKKSNKSNKENCPPKKEKQTLEKENINIYPIHNNKQNVKSNKTIDKKKKIIKTQESHEDKNNSNSTSKIRLAQNKLFIKKKKGRANSNTNIKLDKNFLLKSNEKSNLNSLTNSSNVMKKLTFFDQYLSTQLNEMRFNDALINDKRLFFDFFCDKLKRKQVILEIFFVNDPIKPRTLKILLLILDIEVCFVVNGMFINEDYISKLFHSTEKENFISFLPRSIDRCIYTIIASVLISYIMGCFFVEERRLKSIFKYERNNYNAIKYEVSLVMNEMKWRYNIFILVTLVNSIFSWYYISCFNNIYPHMKIEWIKSSVLIILLVHLLYIIVTLVGTVLRFVSFEIKSEKMYKASLWLT